MLLLDAGNTRLKWALHDGQTIVESGAIDYGELSELQTRAARLRSGTPVIGVNVAGPAVAESIVTALKPYGFMPRWNVACRRQCGVHNSYEVASQLGADRWAALIGARTRHRGAALVVMAGTATTVDLLDETGAFLGGLIFPGFDLMRTALAGNTAQLPLADGRYADRPKRTTDAIFSGCLQAQVGAVERMFPQLEMHPAPICLVGGGSAELLMTALSIPCRHEPNLVLHGLAEIGLELGQCRD